MTFVDSQSNEVFLWTDQSEHSDRARKCSKVLQQEKWKPQLVIVPWPPMKYTYAHDKKILQMILARNPLLTSVEVVAKGGLSGVKYDKRPKIFRNL